MRFSRVPGAVSTPRASAIGMVLLLALGGCNAYNRSLLKASGSHPSPGSGEDADGGFDAALPGQDARVPSGGGSADARVVPDAASEDASGIASGQPDASMPDNEAGAAGSGPRACMAAAVGDYCAQLPSLPAAPEIDGVLDCDLGLQRVTPEGWNGAGSVPSGLSAQIAAAWRSDGLYVYVEVRGQAPMPHPSGSRIDCGDAVELYVDSDGTTGSSYDTPGTMQFIVAAPSASSPQTIEAARYNGGPHGVWSSQALHTMAFADGYAVEAFITPADLDLTAWSPASGGSIGLDVAIDVSASAAPYRSGSGCPSTGAQLGQYFLRVSAESDSCNHEPYCDPRAFCTPELQP